MKKDKAAVRYEIAGFADFGSHRLKSYFPSSYSNEDMEKVIFQLLEEWQQRTGGGEVG